MEVFRRIYAVGKDPSAFRKASALGCLGVCEDYVALPLHGLVQPSDSRFSSTWTFCCPCCQSRQSSNPARPTFLDSCVWTPAPTAFS